MRRRATNRDATPNILEFVENREWLGLVISPAQRVLLKAIYGLALESDEERALYRRCTGRTAYGAEGQGFAEVTIVAGARSGKDSRIAAPIVLYEAIFGGHVVARGEVGVVPLYAQNQKATEVAFQYVAEYANARRLQAFTSQPKSTEVEITSATGQRMRVICFPCTPKAIRGFSVPAAVMDEVAFFRADNGAIIDREVQRAIRRGMIGFTRRRLVKISTPSTQVGVLYEDFARYYGQDGAADVLVWHAPTTLMNPSITEADLAEDRRKDPIAARREYDAEFLGDDATAYLAAAWIEAARVERRFQLEAEPLTSYRAGCDPSGGGADEFTLAIAHADGGRIVQDVSRAWSGSRTGPVELRGVVAECAGLLRRYGVGSVVGDHFAGKWIEQEFAQHGISYTPSEFTKAQAYREAKPFFQEGRLEVLDDGVLLGQLGALQESWRPGGRVPTVDHPRGGHDDRANALALVVAEFARTMSPAVTVTSEQLDREDAAAHNATHNATRNWDAELARLWRGRAPGAGGFWGGGHRRVGFAR